MRVRLTMDPDERVVLESPYDAAFVERLKKAIPWDGREWHPGRKRWLVSALYVTDLVQFLEHWGIEIQDDRHPEGALIARPPMPEDLRLAYDALHAQYSAPLCVLEGSFKALVKFYHPDKGGNPADFHQINDAIATVRRYLNPKPEETSSHECPIHS